MEIVTKAHGKMEISEDRIITIPDGLFGFEKYTKNYEFTYINLNEIRLTGGACLICEKTNELRKYNIHIFDVNNGSKLYFSTIIFKPDKKIIFFELIRNYLFIKQQDNY